MVRLALALTLIASFGLVLAAVWLAAAGALCVLDARDRGWPRDTTVVGVSIALAAAALYQRALVLS